MVTPDIEALGNVGKAIGQLGQAIFVRAEKQKQEDKQAYLLEDASKTELNLLQLTKNMEEAKTYDEVFDTYSAFNEYKNQVLDKNYLSLDNIDTETSLGKRIRQLNGFTDNEKIAYQNHLVSTLNSYDSKLSSIVAGARDTRNVEIGQKVKNTSTLAWINGTATREQVREAITVGFSTAKNASVHIAEGMKEATIDYLQDAFDKGKIDIINAFNKGEFNQDLMGATGDKNAINFFRDRTGKAISEIASNKYPLEKYDGDLDTVISKLKEDKELNLKGEVLIDTIKRIKDNYATLTSTLKGEDEQFNREVRSNVINAIRDKKIKEAWRIYDDARKPDLKGKIHLSEENMTTLYHLIDAEVDSIASGKDSRFKKTDDKVEAYITKLYFKGKLTTNIVDNLLGNGLSTDDAVKWNKRAEEGNPTVQRLLKNADDLIEREFAAVYERQYEAAFTAEEIQKITTTKQALLINLDRGVTQGKNKEDMLTIGHQDYIVGRIIEEIKKGKPIKPVEFLPKRKEDKSIKPEGKKEIQKRRFIFN
ncbi:MAG: hypothetical protein WA066_02985 [Candidatus Omnitrophota bacterium]